MIRTDAEFQTTREYVDRLQRILLELRRTHTPRQYESMSKAYLRELAKAQRELTLYLSLAEISTAEPNSE
jgi:hypothetical protein